MRVYTKEEVLMNQEDVLNKIRSGEIFIHPTDTIYGLGCNALNNSAVKNIRDLKKRYDTPLSVIVPGKDWILENCEVSKEAEKWIDKLPGPYTLVLKLNNKNAVAQQVNLGNGTIGVRIPDHWFQEIATILDVPIVTTSVNETGKRYMTSLEDINPNIQKGLHFTIYEGEKEGSASHIVHLETEEIKIRKR